MATSPLLVGQICNLPVLDFMLVRVVELATTYLVHSTLFLLGGWALLPVLLWLFRKPVWPIGKRRPDGPECPSYAPALTERVWKLAAVLALVTAPLSVLTGWSRPSWEWTWRESPVQEAVVASVEVKRAEPTDAVESLAPDFLEVPSGLPDEQAANTDALPGEIPFALAADMLIADESIHDSILFSADSPLQMEEILEPPVNQPLLVESPAIAPVLVEAPVVSSEATVPQRTPEVEPTHAGVRGLGIALVAWFALSVMRLVTKGAALNRRLAKCLPVQDEWQRELNRLAPKGCDVRLLRAGTSKADKNEEPLTLTLSPPRRGARGQESITEPFACGLFRWTIVLPDGIEQRLSSSEMRALLAHEVAHLVRRDPWWQWIGELLCTCLAFQPLNFLARWRWQQAAELLCDDWAVERRVSATSLASCLTKIAEWRLDRRAALMGLTAVGHAGLLAHRIEWLLRNGRASEPKRPRARTAATLTTFAAGLLVGLYGPRLSLIVPAEANEAQAASLDETALTDNGVANSSADDAIAARLWNDIELDLHHTLIELARLESRLATDPDPEVASLAQRLRTRAATLKERVAR